MTPLTQWPEEVYPTRPLTLPAAATGADLAALRPLCWAAQLAYEVGDTPRETEKLGRILGRWQWSARQLILPVDGGIWKRGTRGYIAEAADALIIAFSGTEPTNWTDWLTDFDFTPIEDQGIHGGFYDAAELVWDLIKGAVAADDVGRRIFFTGHSLGAAIAAITAFHLVTRQGIAADRLQVVPFGMPRIGHARFADAYRASGLAARTYRLIHGADLVPLVPPYTIGFRHVGNLLACPHLGSFDPADFIADMPEPLPAPEDLDAIRTFFHSSPLTTDTPPFPGSRLAGVLPRQIRDHLIDCYLRALGETVEAT